MRLFRKVILFPFSILYLIGSGLRNLLYDIEVLKSYNFDIPIINVGNLSVGGTGKTPVVEYLIRLFKENNIKTAYLSRGYKRKTKGFILIERNDDANKIGDEAFQIKSKFDNLTIAVCENRAKGIAELMSKIKNIQVIILDDAFQHRRVKAGFNILVSDYNKPFFKDSILPSGNLRECKRGAKRADHIFFTKTSQNLKEFEIDKSYTTLQKDINFSYINYLPLCSFNNESNLELNKLSDKEILLFTGIGNASYIDSFLNKKSMRTTLLRFRDHYDYSENDFNDILKEFDRIQEKNKIVVTTEKDISRIKNSLTEELFKTLPLFYLPIEIGIHDFKGQLLDQKVLNYVRKY